MGICHWSSILKTETRTSDTSFTEVDFNINEVPIELFLKKRKVEDITCLLDEIITAIDEESETVGNKDYIKDSYDRLHVRTPQTGPALLVARPIKYQQSNIVSHISDLEDILTMPQHEKKR